MRDCDLTVRYDFKLFDLIIKCETVNFLKVTIL